MISIKCTRLAMAAVCAIWATTGLSGAEKESLPHHFIRFEKDEGYDAGNFVGPKDGFQLLQGKARIVRENDSETGQCLETTPGQPYASILFYGERVSRNQKTYFEVWVRPSASLIAESEEFMDFDGAVLGFFADEAGGHATFHAYHALPDQDGYWVSTGVSAVVDPSGLAREWIRIGICQNLATGTWDLEIGGEDVLAEIQNTGAPAADGIQLWFLGHATRANRFDDVLISPVEPDSLRLGEEKRLADGRSSEDARPGILDRNGERKVGRKQSGKDRRRHDSEIPDGMAKTAPKVIDFEADIIAGGTQHGKFDHEEDGEVKKYAIYSPKYDKDGKPLPLTVRIQCDSELAEGVDLSKIVWVVIEMAEPEDTSRKVIVHGTFQSGFTQIAEIPSEWANKATQIRVGTDLVIRKTQ